MGPQPGAESLRPRFRNFRAAASRGHGWSYGVFLSASRSSSWSAVPETGCQGAPQCAPPGSPTARRPVLPRAVRADRPGLTTVLRGQNPRTSAAACGPFGNAPGRSPANTRRSGFCRPSGRPPAASYGVLHPHHGLACRGGDTDRRAGCDPVMMMNGAKTSRCPSPPGVPASIPAFSFLLSRR